MILITVQYINVDTVLHILMRKSDNTGIILSLIKGGAKIDIQNNDNETSLDIAVEKNNEKIIKLLKNPNP